MKTKFVPKWLPLAAVTAASFLALPDASAVLIRIDEGGFVGWAQGTAPGASSILGEEDNLPAHDRVGSTSYVTGTWQSNFVAPETLTESMHIEGEFHLSLAGPGNGNVVSRKFNIYDPIWEGGALSDTLLVTFTGLGATTEVKYHFHSDSLNGGDLAAFTGMVGTDLFNITEDGTNQSLNALASGWLTGTGVTGTDVDFEVRSAVPEPATAGFGFALMGVCLARRRRSVKQGA